jgi:Domain of unknown function (DUF4082)
MKCSKPRKHLRYLYLALALCGIFIAALASSPAPTQAALTPPVSAYEGVFERADCSQISGLAYDNDAPDSTISVEIYADFYLIATVPADRFRRDLSLAGWENPYHGFLFSTPNSLKDGKTHQITVTFAGTGGVGLSGNPKFIACNASIFPTAVPVTTASGEGKTWEQGVEFSSNMSGIITKVRFWRSAGEPVGGHTARIWSTSGARLTSASFLEPGTPGTLGNPGWVYAPVNFPITAGTRYRVTYNVNYEVAKTFFVFNNGPITKGPLTAWSSWYGTPAGSFPTSHSTSNLFADIVFDSPR